MTQRSLIGLRAILERHSIKQSELARAVGVNAVSVWQWVNGGGKPNAGNLLSVLAFLRQYEPGLEADDMFAEDGRTQAVGQ